MTEKKTTTQSTTPRFLGSGSVAKSSSNDGGDSASGILRIPRNSKKKKARRSKSKTQNQSPLISVSNICGGLIYLRGPKIGEIRLAHGESFIESESLMPMGLITKLMRTGKIRVSTHPVDGEY
jgi:hypothetical protein